MQLNRMKMSSLLANQVCKEYSRNPDIYTEQDLFNAFNDVMNSEDPPLSRPAAAILLGLQSVDASKRKFIAALLHWVNLHP